MALMDDLGKALKDGKIDAKEVEKMAKDVMPGLDLGAISKGFAQNKDAEKVSKNIVGGMDQKQMAQIMKMLGSLDTKNLDPSAIAKQFGIPADAVKQLLAMLKK